MIENEIHINTENEVQHIINDLKHQSRLLFSAHYTCFDKEQAELIQKLEEDLVDLIKEFLVSWDNITTES